MVLRVLPKSNDYRGTVISLCKPKDNICAESAANMCMGINPYPDQLM